MWLSPAYTVAYLGIDPIAFECLVIVTVKNGNSFQIDPEIVVEGGGPKPKQRKKIPVIRELGNRISNLREKTELDCDW